MNFRIAQRTKLTQKPTRLSVYRHSFGISQEVLSELSGVPRSSIANYEARANRPGPDAAGRIAAALKISVNEVFPPEEAEN